MISSLFTLKQLEALVWVADLGSFRKAAAHLNTTQPNISARIAGLEATLGLVLMHRASGSVRLTERGEAVVTAARAVLSQAESLIEVAQRPDLLANRLRLGVTEMVACTWLHEYLRQLNSAFPGVSVELVIDLSRTLDTALAGNQLDLAIQNAPFATQTSGEIALGAFDYVWVAAPEIAAQLPAAPTIADMVPFKILSHARHTQSYLDLSAHAEKLGVPASKLVPSSSLASCLQMACDGLGVAQMPDLMVRSELASGRLVRLDTRWTPSPLQFFARYQADKAARFVGGAAQLAATVSADFAARS